MKTNKKSRAQYFKEKVKETAHGQGQKPKTLQTYEQTGADLEETLSGETKELLTMRRGRPRIKRLQEEGSYIRSSFILSTMQIMKLRAIAQRENVLLKALVEEAFKNAIDAYEQKHGQIEIPKATKATAAGIFSE